MTATTHFTHDARVHVGYILLWYPLFTQPFIFREVQGLQQQGVPLTVYSLYGRHLAQCSAEMLAVAGQTRTHGVRTMGRMLLACARLCCLHPLTFLRLLRRHLFYRWPTWEVFGENLWAFCMGVWLARLLKEDGIDVIHAPWPRGTATAAMVASTLSGIPFSTSARGDNLNPADPDLYDKLCAATCIRSNNAADSARMRAMLPASEHAKIELIYNSLTMHVDSLCPVVMGSPVRLLAVGRFDSTKGFEYLLEACHILDAQGFAFTCTLAGGGGRTLGLGAYGETIERLRTQWHLQDKVSLPGLVSHEQMPALFRAHDMFVAPCVVHASGRRDGIPNTIIEALAFGMPVISSRIHAIPEVVRHDETGWLTEQKDPAALAAAIQHLAAHPDVARRYGRAGHALVSTMFDPQTNAQALAAFFARQYACGKE